VVLHHGCEGGGARTGPVRFKPELARPILRTPRVTWRKLVACNWRSIRHLRKSRIELAPSCSLGAVSQVLLSHDGSKFLGSGRAEKLVEGDAFSFGETSKLSMN
jgi:hypothetical protein